MKQDEITQNSYKDEASDEQDKLHINDTRKPPITLKTLNKLRKMRELRKFEKLQQQELIELIYGVPEEQPSF